jgi:hypothetical protein
MHIQKSFWSLFCLLPGTKKLIKNVQDVSRSLEYQKWSLYQNLHLESFKYHSFLAGGGGGLTILGTCPFTISPPPTVCGFIDVSGFGRSIDVVFADLAIILI